MTRICVDFYNEIQQWTDGYENSHGNKLPCYFFNQNVSNLNSLHCKHTSAYFRIYIS